MKPNIVVYDKDGNKEVVKDEKKIDLVVNVNEQLQNKIEDSKVLKWSLIIGVTAVGLFAAGHLFKLTNFAIREYKGMANALRNK